MNQAQDMTSKRCQGCGSTCSGERRGLLAKIHVAKKQMGLTDDQYESMLSAFKVESAKDMTVRQLENLVKLMKHHGWKPVKGRKKPAPSADRLDALRRRCVDLAIVRANNDSPQVRANNDSPQQIGAPIGEKRLAGLTLKICGVSSLTWCKDVKKLEQLLAVLGKIKSSTRRNSPQQSDRTGE